MSDIRRAEDAIRSTDDSRPLVSEPESATSVSIVDRLGAFHSRGLLSDEEFRLAKERITPTDGTLSA